MRQLRWLILPLVVPLAWAALVAVGCRSRSTDEPIRRKEVAVEPPVVEGPSAGSASHTGAGGKGGAEDADREGPMGRDAGTPARRADSKPTAGIEGGDAGAAMLASEQRWADVLQPGRSTRRRCILLAPRGPILLDLVISIGGMELGAANSKLVESVAEDLGLSGGDKRLAWDELLQLPLVRSGWLGNRTVGGNPNEGPPAEYDADGDGLVGLDELGPFLARSVSDQQPLNVRDAGISGDVPTVSPFGPGDADRDNVLSPSEVGALEAVLARLDLNGDGVLAPVELRPDSAMGPFASTGRDTLLEVRTVEVFEDSPQGLLVEEGAAKSDGRSNRRERAFSPSESDRRRKLARKIRSVLAAYSASNALDRTQWANVSDRNWSLLDRNQNGWVDADEALLLVALPPDATLIIQFPWPIADAPAIAMNRGNRPDNGGPKGLVREASEAQESRSAGIDAVCIGSRVRRFIWHPRELTARVELPDVVLQVAVEDGLGAQPREAFQRQLVAAMQDSEFGQLFLTALALEENAFDLLDRDGDGQLTESETWNAWRWMVVRQAAPIRVEFQREATPWSILADADGNRRLSALELGMLSARLLVFDRDGDGGLVADELPLVVELELRRAGPGEALSRMDAAGREAGLQFPLDWFAAMDVNGDNVLDRGEFLGETSDFRQMDANEDGFIARSEVYVARSTN